MLLRNRGTTSLELLKGQPIPILIPPFISSVSRLFGPSEITTPPSKMLPSILFKVIYLASAAVFTAAQCDRTCDILYFANYDDLAPGTVLTGANPYLGIQHSGYTVRDFTDNGVLTVPSGPNALIAINPYIPTNRATLTVYQPQIQILDPESAFLACVTVDKATKKIQTAVECYVQVVGSGPNYYIVEDVWHFTPSSRKTSSLQLFNLGDKFNGIGTIELHLLNTTSKLKKNQENAIVLDEFIYGGRLSN
ncbi:MAG: hypothetical protein L6R40_008423 [Gallowayella cf. fulva]|nr:MAG: hypothetical protein L6R40_008423 [Xanthomendoza cf. fulva]